MDNTETDDIAVDILRVAADVYNRRDADDRQSEDYIGVVIATSMAHLIVHLRPTEGPVTEVSQKLVAVASGHRKGADFS